MNSEENSRLPTARRKPRPGPTSVARVRRSAWRVTTRLMREGEGEGEVVEEIKQEQVGQVLVVLSTLFNKPD